MRRPISLTTNNLFFTDQLPVHVNRIEESFRLEQHRHEFYECCYVSEGRGFHYIEGETIPVAQGDAFYLPVGVSHVFRPSTPDPDHGRLIVYNCIFTEEFAAWLVNAPGTDLDIRQLLSQGYPEQPWLHFRDRDGELKRGFEAML